MDGFLFQVLRRFRAKKTFQKEEVEGQNGATTDILNNFKDLHFLLSSQLNLKLLKLDYRSKVCKKFRLNAQI